VNPPAGMESDEMILATWGVSGSALRDAVPGPAAVGICEGELTACPQERQNRLSAGI